MSKLLYLICSHNNPDQVKRLVYCLKNGDPDSLIFIHHDSSSSLLDKAYFSSLKDIYFIDDYVRVEWGDFSMVGMMLHCLKKIHSLTMKFDWLFLLSGQDYPVKPLREIKEFYEVSTYDAYLLYDKVLTSKYWHKYEGFNRYYFNYFKIPKFKYWHKIPETLRLKGRKLRNIFNEIQPFLRIKPLPRKLNTRVGIRKQYNIFNNDFECYGGAQWFTINKNAYDYIISYVDSNPSYVDYFRFTLIPDEAFFHTILLNNNKLNICNDYKRFISWSRSDAAHPDTLTSTDFSSIILSDRHFARKFDVNVDTKVLDMLDEHIGNNNVSTGNNGTC
ncbi:MAG: hypothetical protein FD174_167 [Geobacteraceae bacterium]|nr:MAG: hypothetical protein FD174_167 [Geobacteraceae bacterium]